MPLISGEAFPSLTENLTYECGLAIGSFPVSSIQTLLPELARFVTDMVKIRGSSQDMLFGLNVTAGVVLPAVVQLRSIPTATTSASQKDTLFPPGFILFLLLL